MKIYLQIIVLLSLLSLTACKDWLDLQPEGQATSEDVFATGDGYRTVLTGIYQAMASANLYGTELQFGIVDCISRQYTWRWNYNEDSNNKYRIAHEHDYYHTALRPVIDKIWKDGFNVVANANNLIQYVEQASSDLFAGGETERSMILGEAYACRALMHFDLLRLFAPAPLNDDGEARVPYVEEYPNVQPVGIDVNTFLERVVRDLNKARGLTMSFDTTALGMSMSASGKARFYGELEYGMEGYQNPNTVDGFYTGRGYRLSYYAITALLARVYQYAGDHKAAFHMADTLLNFKATGVSGSSYNMFSNDELYGCQVDNYEQKTDLKVVSNLIFGIFNDEAYDSYNLGSFFQKRADGMNKGNWLMLDLDYQKIFEHPDGTMDESEIDIRSRYLLYKPEDNSIWGNYKISAKWYCSDNQTIRKANIQILPVIRATEMRYIMAEYYARNNQFAEAYEILNQIRQQRGTWAEFPVPGQEWGEWKTMEDLPVAFDYDTFQRDLLRDAQREWISEGQLFYLYKRLGAKIYFKDDEIRALNKSEYMFPVPDNQNM